MNVHKVPRVEVELPAAHGLILSKSWSCVFTTEGTMSGDELAHWHESAESWYCTQCFGKCSLNMEVPKHVGPSEALVPYGLMNTLVNFKGVAPVGLGVIGAYVEGV